MKPEIYTGLKWGALLGGPLAILETFLYLLAYLERNAANLQVAGCLWAPLEALLPFIAGFIATRQSSQVRSGLIAGLAAGLIVALVNMITELIYPLPADFVTLDAAPLTGAELMLGFILDRVMTIGFGAGFGWLGGQQAARFAPPRDRGR